MSNTLAIATVSATLKDLLNAAAIGEFPGVAVNVGLPKAPNADPAPEINISLYQAMPNITYRNNDLPGRDSQGRLFKQPRLALDLYYLISFYGDEQSFEPQRLLGRAVRALHVQPVLTQDMLSATIGSSSYPDLSDSNLDEEPIEQVKFIYQANATDEITKLWSALFHHIPYSLSVAYMASVVILEGEETLTINPNVQNPQIRTLPLKSSAAKGLAARTGILPLQKAAAVSFTDIDTNSGLIGGNIQITHALNEADITHYAVYWGSNSTTKLVGQPAIIILEKTGNNLTYALPTGTPLPVGATHLLVFTMNNQGEMPYGINTLITDITA